MARRTSASGHEGNLGAIGRSESAGADSAVHPYMEMRVFRCGFLSIHDIRTGRRQEEKHQKHAFWRFHKNLR
jgi:hypothetical protein